jgi:AraC family transcriptional regulator
MEWIVRLNEAVSYMENNLDKEISYERAAQIACCSTFHFIRMFTYIAGIPLSEYVRRRRLTLAAFDIQRGDGKIVDIALRYFSMAITGGAEMQYRIEKKESFTVVGVGQHFSMKMEECFEEVPKFWQRTIQAGTIPKIMEYLDSEPQGLLGVSACMEGTDFDYFIAVASTRKARDSFVEYRIPASTWAIFECIGPMPHAIQDLQRRIISEWLPTSGYEYSNAPDIEVYFAGDQQANDYRCEVWLPVTRKSD